MGSSSSWSIFVEELLYLHVAQATALVVCLYLVKVLVFRPVRCKVLGLAEGIEVGEHSVALDVAGVFNTQVGWVGVHRFHLFLYVLGCVRQVDAVAKAFRHFGFAIGSRQTAAHGVLRQQDVGLYQCIAIYVVETAHNFGGLLKHRLLVFTRRHCGGTEGGDVAAWLIG